MKLNPIYLNDTRSQWQPRVQIKFIGPIRPIRPITRILRFRYLSIAWTVAMLLISVALANQLAMIGFLSCFFYGLAFALTERRLERHRSHRSYASHSSRN